MSGFTSDWLALREPLDLAARNQTVEQAFLNALPSDNPKIMDLASGAGSTVTAISRQIPSPSNWLLTDYDPDLLKIAETRHKERIGCSISTRQIDLAENLETLPFSDVDAVTTSAFLDLVSEEFLTRLVERVVVAGKPFLASLTYDGRTECGPADPFDSVLFGALNQHQRTDKGFGPALGPDAAKRAVEMFEEKGFEVVQGSSDWHVSVEKRDFLGEFLRGCLRVGYELKLDPDQLKHWWNQRLKQIEAGEVTMIISHLDFVVLPK
ncbi:MAG: methyltransferase domain-containing protein [Roseibium sp.]